MSINPVKSRKKSSRENLPSQAGENSLISKSMKSSFRQTLIMDVLLPLVSYYLLRHLRYSTVDSLILSGIFPAIRILYMGFKQKNIDALGILVLFGIVSGALLGLTTGSAKIVLVDGVLPTAVVGILSLGSLYFKEPFMYYFALEARGGKNSPEGREFESLLRTDSFLCTMRLITLVWGIGLILEATLQVWVILKFSIIVAKTTSNIMPLIFIAVLFAWTLNLAKARHGEFFTSEAQPSIE